MRIKSQSYRSHTDYQPDWMSFEVHEALSALSGDHIAKKEITVLRLAEATAMGEPWKPIFHRSDTCTAKIWYGFTDGQGEQKRGWKDDPVIAHALAVATERARWWVRVRRGKAVESALDVMVDAAPAIASQLVRIATEGRVLVQIEGGELFRPADVRDIVKASESVLDRVDKKTASKHTAELTGKDGLPLYPDNKHDLTKLTVDELMALRAIVAKAAPDADEVPSPG